MGSWADPGELRSCPGKLFLQWLNLVSAGASWEGGGGTGRRAESLGRGRSTEELLGQVLTSIPRLSGPDLTTQSCVNDFATDLSCSVGLAGTYTTLDTAQASQPP